MSASLRVTVLGIDIGTHSARCSVIDTSDGRQLSTSSCPLTLHHPHIDVYEYSAEQIWRAVCTATRSAIQLSGVDASSIAALAFDATCSLVVLGDDDSPLCVTPDPLIGQPSLDATAANEGAVSTDVRNVIAWLDHRSMSQAAAITATHHPVLQYACGGTMSPEMHLAKIRWLKDNWGTPGHDGRWRAVRKLMDLSDYLAYRASGMEARSVCTVTCKMAFQSHLQSVGKGWDDEFFRDINLGDLVDEGYARIGRSSAVLDIGTPLGPLTSLAAEQLGVTHHHSASSQLPIVAVGLIDAHAGGLGVIGASLPPSLSSSSSSSLEGRIAIISGTSSCHMTVTAREAFVPGIWGPYYSSMVPGSWLLEGGESATGALLDCMIDSHPAAASVREAAHRSGTMIHDALYTHLLSLAARRGLPDITYLTRDIHILPYFHGNRSPRADPTLTGIITGLTLTHDIDDLAIKYLAAVQSLAYGTRHILDALRAKGVPIHTIFLTGGLAKNELFVRTHADATGCVCVLSRESDGVLLGAAVVAATAARLYPSIIDCMKAMSHVGKIVTPTVNVDSGVSGTDRLEYISTYHNRKYSVFMQLYEDSQKWKSMMRG